MPARTLRGTPEGWTRVAEHVRRRRIQELGLSADQVAERSGKNISVTVLSILENARQEAYQVRVLTGLCRALGWRPDSIERILAGKEPVKETDQPAAPGARITEDEYVRRLAEVERKLAYALDEVERLKLGRHRPERNDTELPAESS